jgi:hypothetical protein
VRRFSIDDFLFLATVFVSAAMGFFLGLAGGTFERNWTQWLQSWDALLAGLLALVAAFVTIFQMQRTDAAQQGRHEQLVRQQTRADRLRAERAATPFAGLIRLAMRDAERLSAAFAAELKPLQRNSALIQELAAVTRRVVDGFQNELIEDAKDLFDPSMAIRYQAMSDFVTLMGQYAGDALRFSQQGLPNNKSLDTVFGKVTALIAKVKDEAFKFAADLERLPSRI